MQTSLFISPNTLLLECIINPSGGGTKSKNPFGTVMELQNRKIIGIEAFDNQDAGYSPISTSNATPPLAVFKNSFLTLYTAATMENGKVIRPEGLYYAQVPLSRLRMCQNQDNNSLNAGSSSNELFRIRATEISWTKSYVEVPQSVLISQQYSQLFLVHYLDVYDQGIKYM